MKAIWNGAVLAESGKTLVVEGNHYFPPDSVNRRYLEPSPTPYHCPWKGDCQYYDVIVEGQRNKDAAWTYPDPLPAAKHIENYVAFWRGVHVTP